MNNEVNNNQIQRQTNTLAIVGFIFSFFIAIVGLILSILGLKKSKELKNGKGLSIAGIIISSITILINIIVFILTLYFVSNSIIGVSNQKYCKNAYDCVPNVNGTYTCKYKNDDSEVNTITCNKNQNDNKSEVKGEVIKNSNNKYTLIKPEYSGEAKVIYEINDNFTMEFRNFNNCSDNYFCTYSVYVNNNLLMDYESNFQNETSIYILNNNLLYVNTGTTDIRSNSLYIVNTNGQYETLYELDDVKGMAFELIVDAASDEFTVSGSRLNNGGSICYGDSDCSSGDTDNSIRLCEENTYSKFGVSKSTDVKANYTYKIQDGKVNLKPTKSNIVTIEQFLKENPDYCN